MSAKPWLCGCGRPYAHPDHDPFGTCPGERARGFCVATWTASVDARVWVVLDQADTPAVLPHHEPEPWAVLAARAGVHLDDLRPSMRRLVLRTTEGPARAARA